MPRYVILDFNEELDRNVELMEEGRGTEYGCVGRLDGRRYTAVAYSGCGLALGAAAAKADVPLHYRGMTQVVYAIAGERRPSGAEHGADVVGAGTGKETGGAQSFFLGHTPSPDFFLSLS